MTEEKHPKFQSLMNEAFEVWQTEEGKKLNRVEITRELSPAQRMAFVLGTLNYQVENGGFGQWHFNGYSDNFGDTVWAVKKIGGERAEKLLTILQDVEDAISDGAPQTDRWGDIVEEDATFEHLEMMDVDSKYYKFNNDWINDIENFFVNR
jgi:hypothetical protein